MFLPDNFYTAIGLRGLEAFYGEGAVLVSTESILKVNDLSFEKAELKKIDDDDFIETIQELHGMHALLMVYSDGTVKFLTQNADSGVVDVKETGSRFANLVGGQLH